MLLAPINPRLYPAPHNECPMRGDENHTDIVKPQFFGSISSIFLLILWLVLGELSAIIHRSLVGTAGAARYWYYSSIPPTVALLCIATIVRPKILLYSRWQLTPKDLLVAVFPPILIQAIPLFFVRDPRNYFAPSYWPSSAMFYVAFLGPALEEVFCRGVILRSLTMRIPRFSALLAVSVMVSAGHPAFWEALPRQVILSLVYLASDNSLAASILCHTVLNAFIFIPLGDFFQRWHIYTIWN